MMGKLQMYGLMALGVVLAILGLFTAGGRSANRKLKHKLIAKRLDNMKTEREIRRDVEIDDDVGLAERAGHFVRNGNDK